MKKILIAFICSLSSLFCFGQNWDIDLSAQINPAHPDSRFWEQASASAYWDSAALPTGFLAMGLAKKDPRLIQTSIKLLEVIAVELVISESMKSIVDRRRPGETYPTIIHPYADLHGRSFPSGHVSLAFGEATAISLQYRKWYITLPLYTWATSVAYSRVYLGVHYPSDVIAGAAVGIGSGYLSRWLNSHY